MEHPNIRSYNNEYYIRIEGTLMYMKLEKRTQSYNAEYYQKNRDKIITGVKKNYNNKKREILDNLANTRYYCKDCDRTMRNDYRLKHMHTDYHKRCIKLNYLNY
tara:strand:+ start:26 stop:337 length:312 start_codon:yes stop_codon:yes gene_type:complete